MTEPHSCKQKRTIKVAEMTQWQKDAPLLSYKICYFLWFSKLQHWVFLFFWVSTEWWRRLAQFRWNEHLHYVCIPPEVRSLKGSKCASLCAYLIGDAALHTCTNWHWIKVSPLPQACPQPQPSPLTTPSWWSHCFIPPCNLHVWITQTTHSSLSQCVELIQLGGSPKLYMRLMLSCRLWGGNMIGRMRHPNPSHT